jgi:propanediol dehydratase small subunit
MNAGTLTVAVQGDFSAFLAQMSKLQQAAEAEAKRVGDVVSKSMTSRIGDGLGRVKDDIVKTAEQIPRAAERALPKVVREVEKTAKTSKTIFEREFGNEKIGGLFGRLIGIGAIDGLVRSFTAGLKGEKTIGQSLYDFAAGLPVAGAFFELGWELGDSLATGLLNALNDNAVVTKAEAAAATAAAREEEARTEAMNKANVERAKARQAELDAEYEYKIDSLHAARDIEEALTRESVKMQADAARESGDERKAIEIELAEELRQLADERIQALGATGGDEAAFNRARDAFTKREQFAKERAERRIREVQTAEEEAALEVAEKQRQIDEKAAKDALDAAEKQAKAEAEIRGEIVGLLDQRMTQGAAGISSAQTALGAFTFDAYPDQQKRKNDEAIVKQITELNRKASVAGGFS